MVMRYERGRTLQQQIQMRQDQMSERFVRHVFMHLLNGLREVHTHKLLHLDIKPANIYLRTDGIAGAARLRRRAADADQQRGRSSRRCTRPDSPRPSSTASPTGSARGPTSTAPARRCSRASRRSRRRPPMRGCRRTTWSRRRRSGPASTRTTCSRSSTGACGSIRSSGRRACSRCRRRSATSRRRKRKLTFIGNLKRDAVLGDRRVDSSTLRLLHVRLAGMRFTIFQESRKGSRKVNQDRIAYTYSRDTLLLVRRRRHGRPRRRRDRRADRGAAVHRALPAGSEADPAAIRSSSCRTRCCARTRRSAPTRTSSRCWRRRARPASPVVVQAGHAYWAHVGDSRFYLFRQGGADRQRPRTTRRCSTWSTRESSAPTRSREHPDRNKIFSCLGGLVDPVIDLSKRTPLRNGDVLVLCTDGLWSVMPQREIADLADVDADPQDRRRR